MILSIVTGNTGKYAEISQVLDGLDIQQTPIDIPEIQTNILTDISSDKCLKAFEEVGGPVLVDDSGVYFDALNNFPGALTKYFIDGLGVEGIKRLYTGVENRKARFVSVISYMDETLSEPKQFIGEVAGILVFDYIDKEDLNPTLPYNRIFQANGMDVPALFDLETWKRDYNFRMKATGKFREWYLNR